MGKFSYQFRKVSDCLLPVFIFKLHFVVIEDLDPDYFMHCYHLFSDSAPVSIKRCKGMRIIAKRL